MEEEQMIFVYTYEQMVESMVMTMQERGEGRDEETPIHFRRSPEANLEMVRSKCMRIESMLTSLDTNDPDITILRKLRNESLDVANYALFTATNMELLISEKLLEDMDSVSQGGKELSFDGVVEEEFALKYDEITEVRNGNLYCILTNRICPRTVAWGEAKFCFGADAACNKLWLPKEKGK
jgi:hypothetical protein